MSSNGNATWTPTLTGSTNEDRSDLELSPLKLETQPSKSATKRKVAMRYRHYRFILELVMKKVDHTCSQIWITFEKSIEIHIFAKLARNSDKILRLRNCPSSNLVYFVWIGELYFCTIFPPPPSRKNATLALQNVGNHFFPYFLRQDEHFYQICSNYHELCHVYDMNMVNNFVKTCFTKYVLIHVYHFSESYHT